MGEHKKNPGIKNPLRRKLIQIAAFGFCNSHVANLISGKIYTGKWKKFCVPGLNCYSCPAAAFSCPIGAMQAVSGSTKFNFSFYVTGLILAFGVIFGRAICGFLCPFGLIQEIIHKIPGKKIRLWKPLRYIKYAVLLVFVLILPVADTNYAGSGDPAFCKYICPAGSLEAALPLIATNPELKSTLGGLFVLKISVLIVVLLLCVFIHRFFCKTLCPLGAIYAMLNKVSLMHVSVDKGKCVSCGKCGSECPMDVNPVKEARSGECIMCGKCADICPVGAIAICISEKKISEKNQSENGTGKNDENRMDFFEDKENHQRKGIENH